MANQGYPVQQYTNLNNDVVLEILSDGTIVLKNGNVIATGNGSPNGVVTANVGSLYTQSDGVAPNILWQKQTGVGNTGWVSLGAGGGGATPPGGNPTDIQFNGGGVFGGDDNFAWSSVFGLNINTSGSVHAITATEDIADTGATSAQAGNFIAAITNTSPVTIVDHVALFADIQAGLNGVTCTIDTMDAIRTVFDAGTDAVIIGSLSALHITPGVNVPTVPPTAVYGIHIEDVSSLLGTVTRAIKVDGLAGSEFDGPGGFGPNNAVGQIGPIGYASGNTTGAPRSRSLLDVEGSYTTPESAHFTTAAIVAGIDANAAANDTDTSWYGVFSTSQSHVSNTNHMSELIGGLFQAEHYATGIMDEVNGLFVQTFCPTGSGAVGFNIGIDVSAQPSSASNTTTDIGIRVKTGQYNASGTIANNYGIQVQSPNTTGHLTHNYGIRIEDQSLGGANNPDPWSLYVVGGTTFLGGPLQLSTITKMNGETTVAPGAAYIRGNTVQKNETGADANVLTVTPPAVAGVYRLSITMSVSAANTATGFGWTATWTDSNGQAQAPGNLALYKTATASAGLTFTAAAAGVYYADTMIDTNNSGTPIVIKTTFSGTSIAYKVSATIERIA